jgi:hypothetical protein
MNRQNSLISSCPSPTSQEVVKLGVSPSRSRSLTRSHSLSSGDSTRSHQAAVLRRGLSPPQLPIYQSYTWKSRGWVSGDRSDQICGLPRSGNWWFGYSVTYRLKRGMPRDARSTSVIVFIIVHIIFNFYLQFPNRCDSDLRSCDISDWEWPQE